MQATETTHYTVGELAKKLAVSTRTIRYYEEIGLLDHPERKGNKRIYTKEHLRRLKFIQRLKMLGLSLAEINELKEIYFIKKSNEHVLERLEELLGSHVERIEKNITELKTLKEEIESYRRRIHSKLPKT